MFHAASAQKYVDASTLTIIGRTCPMEGHPYYRVDTTRYRFDNATIRHYCGYPAGVAVLFTTDSRRIEARWTTAGNLDQEAAKFHRERIDTADGMMRRLAKQYDNVYFLDGEWFFGRDAEGTIDCDHGSALGYDRMISERLPRIRKILRKYGIR